ncbi:MAG: pseudouridine synthase [Chitinophagaceae bacterium]
MKKKATHFDKFTKKKSNAAIKEQFKQEKRKIKKEREEYFENKRAETRKQKSGTAGQKKEATSNKQQAINSRQPTLDNQQPATYNKQLTTGKRQPATSNQQSATGNHHPALNIQQPATGMPHTQYLMPLNKFIAHSGISGRREAAEIVKEGKVKVNNAVVTEPGFKVSAKDDIRVNGKKIFLAKNLVYILLNKPKDFLTTTDDPQGRKTVLDIVGKATPERIYPVGRLDRNTSGVLLLTNDGELSQKLTHPSNNIKKVYAITLNRPLEKKDFDKILKGVMLEDGMANVDALAYADIQDKTILGIEIHSGRNRIVRRIFEALGYDVKNLDRVIFAGLTKKNVERGKWRFLSEKEVRDLKHFGKGK